MHLAATSRRQRLRAELRTHVGDLRPDGPVGDSAVQRAVLRRIGAEGRGESERMYRAARIGTFGGGVSEGRREIVATMRPGMRRGRR